MDRIFPINGECECIGRREILDTLIRNYNKETPSHLQLIGPHYTGKTVILKALANELKRQNLLYTVVYWDLSGVLPDSDEDFLFKFAQHLGTSIKDIDVEAAQLLLETSSSPSEAYELLDELAGIWEEESKQVLIIMDGFEKPINSGVLTSNLWDKLRHLAYNNSSIRLLTGSRDSLRETVRDPASQKSPFFNIFDPSLIKVGCFNERDIQEATNKASSSEFHKGAISELVSQTNGYPICLLECLNVLASKTGAIDSKDVVEAVDVIFESLEDRLLHIWNSMDAEHKEVAKSVVLQKATPELSKVKSDIRGKLIGLGFVQEKQNKLQNPSRIIARLLDREITETTSVESLVGTPFAFKENFKRVLESRLSHLPDLTRTKDVKRYIQRAIDDLPDDPRFCLKNIRGILDETIEQIWNEELVNGKIPPGCFNVWEANGEKLWDDVKNNQFVGNRGAEMQLLRLLTGTQKTKTVLAQKLSNRTVSLICSLHELANFGQHNNGTPINVEVAFAAILSCIEMLNSLVIDFSKQD